MILICWEFLIISFRQPSFVNFYQMLKELTTQDKCVIGLEAVGKVTRDDYLKVMIPASKDVHARCGKIRMLYLLGEQWTGMEYAAMVEDVKLGIRYFWSWQRIAIVTDHRKLAWFAWLSGLLIPGKVEIFTVKNLEKATRWVND
jgi:hypothetical protein